jgi:PAS domain S-box-containing protein
MTTSDPATTSEAPPVEGYDLSSAVVAGVVGYLRQHAGQEVLATVLARAGETRDADWLIGGMGGDTYAEFRRLLEATGELCGSDSLREAGAYPYHQMLNPQFQEALQVFGSPTGILGQLGQLSGVTTPVLEISTSEVDPNEWLVSCRFARGLEPYREFCLFHAGLLSLPPRLYGFDAAEVIEEQCQCDGAELCVFRVSWFEADEQSRLVRHLEYRNELVAARLAGLQRTVVDLVAIDDLESILDKIVASTRRAVDAPGYVLALESLPSATRRVYSVGLDDDVAADLAARLLRDGPAPEGLLAVDVRSTRRTYGRLAAVDLGQRRQYLADEEAVLEAFASVAAAALDVAAALDDTRRQASIAEATSEVLAEERSLLSMIVEGLPHGVCWTDTTGAVEGCNRALATLLGLAPTEVKGQQIAELCPDDRSAAQVQGWVEQVASGGEPVINGELALAVGDESRVVLLSLVPLGGERTSLSIWADVTEQRSMEQRLAEASRLESIGQLAAGIAHEINTPLQYVGNNGAFLDKAFGLVTPLVDRLATLATDHGAEQATIDELTAEAKLDMLRSRIPSAAGQVIEGVDAVSRIVQSLKTFAHPGHDFEPVDIGRAVESTLAVSRNEWRYSAELDVGVAGDLPPVRAVPGMINQVLLNLVINAAHAIDERRAAHGSDELGHIRIVARREGEDVEIEISDDGCGIPDEIRNKVYDQFFTTKPVGKGTGQGWRSAATS